MGGGVTGHTFNLQRSVDKFCDLRVAVVHPLQLRRDLQGAFQRHFQLHRHLLCHHIHALIGHPHHTAHIADGVAGGHGAKGDDLGYMVCAVLPVDVVDDLLTALVAEIDVKIGHTDALGVQESLEDEVVADGVDVGDAYTVSRDAARARATARAYRNALTLGVVDIIPDNEVVVGIAHRLDHADLIGQAVLIGRWDVRAVAALEAVPAELLEELLIVHPVRGFVIWNFGVSKVEVKIALVRDFLGVGAGFRHHCEQLIHFIRRFDVKFVGLELHPVGVLNGLAGLDAEQDALHLGVILPQIVGVVGSCHRDAGLPRQFDELGQDDRILFEAVVLQFNVVIALAEQVLIPQGRGFCPLVVSRQNGLRDLACEAGRQTDKPLVILLKKLLVYTRLGIKALHEGSGHHLDEVLIACLILAEQDKMVVAVDFVDFIEAGAGGHIDLTADDGLDACLFCGLIELDTAVHDAVVRDGDGILAALLDAVHKLVDTAGTVQQAVFGMDVEMNEVSPLTVPFGHIAHAPASSVSVCSSSR